MIEPQIVAEPTKWLGETIGFWVQTLMFTLSAVGGIWIVVARGKQESRRAVVEAVLHEKRDETLKAARDLINKLHESNATNCAKYLDQKDSEEYKAIRLALNTYEFMAVGIRRGAFDEKVYKLMRYSTLIKDWEMFRGFVHELRQARNVPTIFQEFEWLYKRWKADPLKQNQD